MSRVRNPGWRLPALAAVGVVPLPAWHLLPANPPASPARFADPPAAAQPASDFPAVMAKMKAAKADIAKKHNDLLAARYDLTDRAGDGKMTRGKPVQQGPRTK